MPRSNKLPDAVTAEYIEAYRLGVLIRTPLENIAFFQRQRDWRRGVRYLQIPVMQ